MAFGGSFGGLTSKLKGINVNKIINLGFGLWGIQFGSDMAKQVINNMTTQMSGSLPISTRSMTGLVDIGARISQSVLLIRFFKALPFGNILSPIIGITTAATILPQVIQIMMSIIGVSGRRNLPSTGVGTEAPMSGGEVPFLLTV